MKRICAIILAFVAVSANAITATKEYVDRRDGENAVAMTNLVESATNAIPRVTDATVAGWGYIKSWAETDPTVPSWAKATTKPTYDWSEIGSKPTFAAVSTSGAYSDLSGKPSIPTDSTVAGWGYIKSWTETDPTVPSWAKATTKPTYGWTEISNKPSWIGSTKPSYTWNEIGSKPTTLAGYGIEDASISGNTITLGSQSATIPTALKCPNALTIQLNGTTAATYDGSDARTVNITTGCAPGATVASAALEYHADGQAISVSVAAAGTLTAVVNSWTDGQSQMAFVTLAAGASIAPAIKLIGYSEWPIGEEFMAVCTKRGSKIYVNPVCITEE